MHRRTITYRNTNTAQMITPSHKLIWMLFTMQCKVIPGRNNYSIDTYAYV